MDPSDDVSSSVRLHSEGTGLNLPTHESSANRSSQHQRCLVTILEMTRIRVINVVKNKSTILKASKLDPGWVYQQE